MESRGNDPTYAAQGNNYVRSTLNYGVLETLQTHIMGWFQQKRVTYAQDFHTFALEWSPSFVRTYVDTRLQATLTIDITGRGGQSFFQRGHYPATAHNGSDTEVVIDNIWEKAGSTSAAAPFDKPFFLILDLAVGGTSGWFPDGVGNKPWFDTSGDDIAMESFAKNQSVWSKTWPSNEDDLSFRMCVFWVVWAFVDSIDLVYIVIRSRCGISSQAESVSAFFGRRPPPLHDLVDIRASARRIMKLRKLYSMYYFSPSLSLVPVSCRDADGLDPLFFCCHQYSSLSRDLVHTRSRLSVLLPSPYTSVLLTTLYIPPLPLTFLIDCRIV